jgi:hypothetical protein
VLPANNDPPSDQVPEYTIDHFLTFLADVLKGKEGSHVQNATSLIKAYSEGFSDSRGVARDVLSKLESRETAVPCRHSSILNNIKRIGAEKAKHVKITSRPKLSQNKVR